MLLDFKLLWTWFWTDQNAKILHCNAGSKLSKKELLPTDKHTGEANKSVLKIQKLLVFLYEM